MKLSTYCYLCGLKDRNKQTCGKMSHINRNLSNTQDECNRIDSSSGNYVGIDIFSGAGGLSLGAIEAGIDIRYAIEKEKYASQTYYLNHKNVEVICQNITDVDARQIKKKAGDVFIIMGGPPCQGFSLSNTRTRSLANSKNFLFTEFVRFVRDIIPRWILFENVGGFPLFEHGFIQHEIEKQFEELGYTVKSAVLWADQFGVPQRRNRYFLVGNHDGIDFEFPKMEDDYHPITVKEAIGDLPILANGEHADSLPYTLSESEASEYARLMRKGSKTATQNYVSQNADFVIERYKYIPQGGNWKNIPDELMQNYANKARCHSGIYRRLKECEPSVVISNYRKSMLIHPTQDRGLSVREAARIQSFPDTFMFEGPTTLVQQQIGNAVPPLLAKAVISKILSYSK